MSLLFKCLPMFFSPTELAFRNLDMAYLGSAFLLAEDHMLIQKDYLEIASPTMGVSELNDLFSYLNEATVIDIETVLLVTSLIIDRVQVADVLNSVAKIINDMRHSNIKRQSVCVRIPILGISQDRLGLLSEDMTDVEN